MAWPKSTLARSTRESNRTRRCCAGSTAKSRPAAESSIWEACSEQLLPALITLLRLRDSLAVPTDGRFIVGVTSPLRSLTQPFSMSAIACFRKLPNRKFFINDVTCTQPLQWRAFGGGIYETAVAPDWRCTRIQYLARCGDCLTCRTSCRLCRLIQHNQTPLLCSDALPRASEIKLVRDSDLS